MKWKRIWYVIKISSKWKPINVTRGFAAQKSLRENIPWFFVYSQFNIFIAPSKIGETKYRKTSFTSKYQGTCINELYSSNVQKAHAI